MFRIHQFCVHEQQHRIQVLCHPTENKDKLYEKQHRNDKIHERQSTGESMNCVVFINQARIDVISSPLSSVPFFPPLSHCYSRWLYYWVWILKLLITCSFYSYIINHHFRHFLLRLLPVSLNPQKTIPIHVYYYQNERRELINQSFDCRFCKMVQSN